MDNRWLEIMVKLLAAASMQGAVLFGTDAKVAVRPRLRLSSVKRQRS